MYGILVKILGEGGKVQDLGHDLASLPQVLGHDLASLTQGSRPSSTMSPCSNLLYLNPKDLYKVTSLFAYYTAKS